jgi:MerR family transcriptional regulator, light-induced transcriptional regulator
MRESRNGGSLANPQQGLWRIGEISRRTGVGVPLLRAWEQRYGVLQPQRSEGGFRLYSAADEARVLRMRHHIAEGVAAAQAAELVGQEMDRATALGSPGDDLIALREAFDGYDEQAAEAALDRLVATFGVEMFLSHVVLPYLREVGERWARGDVTVAEEHFATGVLRARLIALASHETPGAGPLAILACPEGELHDLPLSVLALAFRARGGRVAMLGAQTPIDEIEGVAERLGADLVVVSGTMREPATKSMRALTRLARTRRVIVAGPAYTEAMAEKAGATYLPDDPVSAAEHLLALGAEPARGAARKGPRQ